MRVLVDKDKCCGSGQCAMTVPEVFDQDEDDGTVLLLEENPPQNLHEAVHEAERLCPTGTISTTT